MRQSRCVTDPQLMDEGAAERGSRAADLAALRARLDSGPLDRVAARYTSAHGHPTDHDVIDQHAPTQRWRLGWRAVIAGAVILIIIAGVFAVRIQSRGPSEVIPLSALEMRPSAAPDGADVGAEDGPEVDVPGVVLVHVVGAVENPGVFEVPAQARVYEAVDAAGGVLKTADLTRINLARTVSDGEQIMIPVEGEEMAPGEGNAAENDGLAGSPGAAGGVLDINSAMAAEFEGLPGIGPVLAERIVAHREAHGPFTSAEQLSEVSGIGPSIMGQIVDLVRV